MICKEGGELSLLLGQGTGNLLLKPVSDIKGKQVSKYLPEIVKDLSLQLTPASDKYSICGAIGGGDPMETSCRLYKSSMKTGHFKFYSPQSPSDISVLRSQYSVATFSAQASSNCWTFIPSSRRRRGRRKWTRPWEQPWSSTDCCTPYICQ